MSAANSEGDHFAGGRGGMADYSGAGGGFGGGQQGQQFDPSNPQQLQRYRFSPEEMRAIRECNRESFYYRCLPIGTLMGVGAFYGVRNGYLKPNIRFGAGPKMAIASIVGYFIGKISYQSTCAEKLMALPNSQLGEALRKKRGRMGFQETLGMEPNFTATMPIGGPAEFSGQQQSSRTYSDVGDTQPMGSFDSESTSTFTGGFDVHQPSYDTTQQMLDDENLPPKRPQFFTSYDDLRRQNRVEYETRHHTPSSPAPGSLQNNNNTGNLDAPRRSPPQNDNMVKSTNKYGDIWDDKPANY